MIQEIEDSQQLNLNFTQSVLFDHEPNKKLKLTTDTLDCDNILLNQENVSVLKTVRSWILKSKLPRKDVESRQCEDLLGYANQIEKLFADKETQLVCRKSKHSPKQICLPQNCFIEAFNAALDHRLSGHPGSEKALLSLKRFFFWLRMYKWVRTLTKNCLTCRKNKQIGKDQNTAPNEKWGVEIPYPFHTVHIDHKGHLNSMSDGKHHCLVVKDVFLRFNQVYPLKSTVATHTIESMSVFITSFGIPQKLVYDRGTYFMGTGFSTLALEFGITHAPRTKWSPWTKGKVEIQNKHLSRSFRCDLSEAGNNWAKLTCQYAFAHNTSKTSSIGTTPYENLSGYKPQIPFSLKLGLVKNDNDLCQSDCCQPLPSHTHVNKETSHSCKDNLISSKSSMDLLNQERQFKNTYREVYRKFEKPIIVSYPTGTSTNMLNHYELDKKTFWKTVLFRSETLKNCGNSEMDRT